MERKLENLGVQNLELLLEQAYDTLSLAVEVAGIGSWDWNLQTKDVYYDKQWLRMIGYEPGELLITEDFWEKRIHPDDKIKFWEYWTDIF